MDIDFNISQIHEYTNFANNVAENISVSFSEIQSLFNATHMSFEQTRSKLQEIQTQISDLLNQASHIKNIIEKKLEKTPKPKECFEKPEKPVFSQNQLVAEKQKLAYEKVCSEIQKANEKAKQCNDANEKIASELSELNQKLRKIIQRLEMINSRCNAIKGMISETSSKFLSQKSNSEAEFRKATNLITQTTGALSNTYSFATPLVESYRHTRVYGNLRSQFKLKKSIKSSIYSPESNNKFVAFENTEKLPETSDKKVVLIKSRKLEEFLEELKLLNLKVGDVVKIPSYNLFNLGGDKLFEEMKRRGFKSSKSNGIEILEDGTIEWVKYE